VLTDQGRYDRARPFLVRALGLFEELGLVDGQAMILGDLADVLLRTGDPAGAVELLRRAVDQWQTMDSPHPLAEALVELARAYDAAGDPGAARKARGHALRIAESMQVPELVQAVRDEMSAASVPPGHDNAARP